MMNVGTDVLDPIDAIILYATYSAGKPLSQKAINKVVPYAILVKNGKLEPVKQRQLLKQIRINHFGWTVTSLIDRLRKLANQGLIQLVQDGRRIYVKPAKEVDRGKVLEAARQALARHVGEELGRVLESLGKAISIYEQGSANELARELEKATDIAGIKYALIGWDAEEYIEARTKLSQISEENRKKFRNLPTVDEFLEMRHRIKNLRGLLIDE